MKYPMLKSEAKTGSGAVVASSLALLLALAGSASAQTAGRPAKTAKAASAVNIPFVSVTGLDPLSVLGRSTLVSHKASTDVLHITVSLPPLSTAALSSFVDQVSNPASASYRQFLTPAQVGAKFGQSAATVQKVVDYLKSQGMTVTAVADNHFTVAADGTVAQIEKAFNTTINNYKVKDLKEKGRSAYYANAEAVQVPKTLGAPVLDVSGLNNFSLPKPQIITADQTRGVYGYAGTYANNKGEGRTVGISNFDGFRLSNLPTYYSSLKLPTPPGGVGSNVKVVAINGGAGSGTPGLEGDLDIQMVLGMVPLCNLIIYDGTDLISVLSREAQDNQADVITESYGWILPESSATAAHNIHLAMSAQGITYMCASGDSGTDLSYFYPTIDGDVMMVGGTIATSNNLNGRVSEVGWPGGGGGWSTVGYGINKRPTYQVGKGVPTGINFRMSPDVAFNASGDNGAYPMVFNGSLIEGVSGTSAASPIFAGLLAGAEQRMIKGGALVKDAQGKARLGRFQDLLYKFNGRSDVLFDIVSGNNGILPNGQTSSATAGWDFASGWGPLNIDGFVGSQTATPVGLTGVSVYSSTGITWGANPTGNLASLSAIDGQVYSLTTVPQAGTGTVAAFIVDAKTALPVDSLSSISISITTTGPSMATNYIYLRNWSVTSKAQYDLVSSASLTGSATTVTVGVKTGLANYVSTSGAIEVMERAIYPTRLGAQPFQLKTDCVSIVARQ